ncbi:hypothetical protein A0H81_05687 [Grifola frondosa]|uniref:Uncharacterized protein n=1 Tax=Grifola frondosa TaxID=5627 RepID=A0A1C7MH64_GRIFR|nr:hypothetical protein A0H81_05687 [Grifola frondosa]
MPGTAEIWSFPAISPRARNLAGSDTKETDDIILIDPLISGIWLYRSRTGSPNERPRGLDVLRPWHTFELAQGPLHDPAYLSAVAAQLCLHSAVSTFPVTCTIIVAPHTVPSDRPIFPSGSDPTDSHVPCVSPIPAPTLALRPLPPARARLGRSDVFTAGQGNTPAIPIDAPLQISMPHRVSPSYAASASTFSVHHPRLHAYTAEYQGRLSGAG